MEQTLDQSQEEPVVPSAAVQRILARLDSMMIELRALRQEVQTITQFEDELPRSLADELYGALGQGSMEELDSNVDIEAMRFGT
jgi:hypothetical protein